METKASAIEQRFDQRRDRQCNEDEEACKADAPGHAAAMISLILACSFHSAASSLSWSSPTLGPDMDAVGSRHPLTSP